MQEAFLGKVSIISGAPGGKFVTRKLPQQAEQTQTQNLDVNLNHDDLLG